MASQWFIARDGVDVGTATSAELRTMATSGELLPTDQLWKEGMKDWRSASDFPQLFPAEEAATVVVSPDEPEEVPSDGLGITINTNESAVRRKKATARPRRATHAQKRRVNPAPTAILGITAEKWMAWFPWAMVFASIGSIFAVVAMRIAVLLPAFVMKGIRMPAGIGSPTVEEPLLWKVAFFLNVAQAVAGPVAFPLLRARKPAGWAIAFGSAIAWMLYESLQFFESRAFSVFVLLPLGCAVAVAYALWRLRSRYGLSGDAHASVVATGSAARKDFELPFDEMPQAVDNEVSSHDDTDQRVWPSVHGTASSLPATITKVRTAANAAVTRATASLRAAGSPIAKGAEQTKIVTDTLASAYAELGKAIYKDGSRRDEFADLFEKAEELLARRKQAHEDAKAHPPASGLTEETQQLAADAAALAKKRAIDLEAYQAFAKLGEVVYERHGNDSGPTEIVKPIAKAIAHRDQLDREMEAPVLELPLNVNVRAASRKATTVIKTRATAAGRVAALTAERAKISTITLPLAYRRLGEHCYHSKMHVDALPDLFAKLDAVHAGRAESEQPAETTADSFAEKAMAWAESGMQMAKSQAQGLQANALFVQLGKACFNQFEHAAGTEELVSAVQALKDRLARINAEVASNVKNTGGAKNWHMIGGGALLCLVMLGAYFHNAGSGKAGGGGSSGGHGRADDLDGCRRGASAEYKGGYASMISMVKAYDSERRRYRREISSWDDMDHYQRQSVEESLRRGTEEHRSSLYEDIRKFEQAIQGMSKDTPGYDHLRGMIDGCKYGLRYILKERY